MVDADDVGGRDGLYGTGAAAGNDHYALVGDGVDGAATFQESPERREDYAESDQEKRQSENWEYLEAVGEGIVGGFGHGAGGVVGLSDPEEGEAGEGDAEEGGRERGDGGATRVGGAGPVEVFAGLEFGLGAELGVVGVHG